MIFATALLAATAAASHQYVGSKHNVVAIAPTYNAFGHAYVDAPQPQPVLRKLIAVSHDYSSDYSSSGSSSSSNGSDSSSDTDSSDDYYISSNSDRTSEFSLSDYESRVPLRDFPRYRSGTSNFAKRGYAQPSTRYSSAYKVGYARW